MIGRTVAHYRILEVIGSGGMGVVYKAEDTSLKRTVALKFLPANLTRNKESNKRFIHEAQAASGLEHSNICTIHEIGETGEGQLFITMAYYEGETLDKKIEHGQVDVAEALDVGIQVARGIARAHEAGIVHRDIKPANIMVTNRGEVRILDFGLAKLSGQSRITREGSTLGTAAYMSPEQARGEEADHRSDIFSFGVVLYELIAGELPFKGEHEAALLYELVNMPAKPLRDVRPELPEGLEQIVQRAMEKDAADRYQHVDELLIDLKRVSGEPEAEGVFRRPGIWRALRRKKLTWLVPTSAVVAIGLMVAGYLLFQSAAEGRGRVTIAVADIRNETGEKQLDGLSVLFITSLEQSRHLTVMPRSRMFDILKQTGKSDVERIDEILGREICIEANIQHLALPSVHKLGRAYTIDLKILDLGQDRYSFNKSESREGQESILQIIDELTEQTRIGLEEGKEDVRASSRAIAEVTTTNMDAFYHYFLGEQLTNQQRGVEAREEYRKAIELDSTFGLAYYRTAYSLYNEEDWAGASPELDKAVMLIGRIPEKERYYVRALKAYLNVGEPAGIEILKEMEKFYPEEKEMLFQIGDWLFHDGVVVEAAEYLEKAVAMDPMSDRALGHLFGAYTDMGEYEKARQLALRMPDKEEMTFRLGVCHMEQGQFDSAAFYFEKVLNENPNNGQGLAGMAELAEYRGDFKDALRYAWAHFALNPGSRAYRGLARVYRAMGELDSALRVLEDGLQVLPDNLWLLSEIGLNLNLMGQYEKAEAHFKSMIEEKRIPYVPEMGFRGLVLHYAYLGRYSDMAVMRDSVLAYLWAWNDTNMAVRHIAETAFWKFMGGRMRDDQLEEKVRETARHNITSQGALHALSSYYLIRGDVVKAREIRKDLTDPWLNKDYDALAHYLSGEWQEALELYSQLAARYPRERAFSGQMIARCLLELGKPDEALKELDAAQETYSIFTRLYMYPRGIHLRGKICEALGDTARAVESYEEFLEFWRDADENLPDLIDAKARLVQLGPTSKSL